MTENNSDALRPIVGDHRKRIVNFGCMCSSHSNCLWLVLLFLLISQVVGIILYTVWAVDCFFREFQATANCKHFTLFPLPQVFEGSWLGTCALGFLTLSYLVCGSPSFYGVRVVIKLLVKKGYFYKISFVVLVAIGYDCYVIFYEPNALKTVSYVFYVLEKSLVVVLMFLVNFLLRGWISDESFLKRWIYKAAFATYAFQNYMIALIGSTIAVYKVLEIPEPKSKGSEERRHDPKSVIALMLLITNNGFRYFVADFFFAKMFDEDLDILGGGTIENSIGTQAPRDRVKPRVKGRNVFHNRTMRAPVSSGVYSDVAT